MQNIIDQMEQKMLSYRDYFKQSRQFGTNENLREDNANSQKFPTHFGLDGSFRMIDIDWRMNNPKYVNFSKSNKHKFELHYRFLTYCLPILNLIR